MIGLIMTYFAQTGKQAAVRVDNFVFFDSSLGDFPRFQQAQAQPLDLPLPDQICFLSVAGSLSGAQLGLIPEVSIGIYRYL